MVPGEEPWPWTKQSWHSPERFVFDQCLALWSVKYRPEIMTATVVALEISKGDSAKAQMGCGLVRDIWVGWKYSKDERRIDSPLSLSSHHDMTRALHNLFQDSLLGGDCRIISGSGRSYCWVMVLSCRNQLLPLPSDRRTSLPTCCRIVSDPSLASMPSSPSCLKCSKAEPGMLPARKKITSVTTVAKSFYFVINKRNK